MIALRKTGIIFPLVFGMLFVCFTSGQGVAGPLENYSLKAPEIEEQALRFLEERIPWDPEMTEVNVDYDGKDIILPAGELEMNFSLPGRKVRLGRFPVQAKITVNKVFQKRLRLIAKLERSIVLIKTSRRVRRGEILTEADVVQEISKSNRNYSTAITSLEDAVGFEAVHSMGAGRVVTINSLRKPPLVKKGDRVMLVVEKGSMKITVPGVVKEKGFKNSLIQVQNLQTKKTVFGQVVDPQTVKVNF
jgi:flagella basal body P-ring formation protein FlgA